MSGWICQLFSQLWRCLLLRSGNAAFLHPLNIIRHYSPRRSVMEQEKVNWNKLRQWYRYAEMLVLVYDCTNPLGRAASDVQNTYTDKPHKIHGYHYIDIPLCHL